MLHHRMKIGCGALDDAAQTRMGMDEGAAMNPDHQVELDG